MLDERMYSLAQAAEEIGVSYSCILKWRKKGKLDGAQTATVGRRRVVMLSASYVEKLRDEYQKRNGKGA